MTIKIHIGLDLKPIISFKIIRIQNEEIEDEVNFHEVGTRIRTLGCRNSFCIGE